MGVFTTPGSGGGGGGVTSVLLIPVSASDFVGNTYTNANLSGLTPDATNGFTVSTNAQFRTQINAASGYYTFAGSTLTFPGGPEDIFLEIFTT